MNATTTRRWRLALLIVGWLLLTCGLLSAGLATAIMWPEGESWLESAFTTPLWQFSTLSLPSGAFLIWRFKNTTGP